MGFLKFLLEQAMPKTELPNPLKTITDAYEIINDKSPNIINRVIGDDIKSLKSGTVVYCNLAFAAEHSGICVGNTIVHLDGSGNIIQTGVQEFIDRLDGSNPAVNIYYAAKSANSPLGSSEIANRALSMVGKKVDYNVLTNNCHGFTIGCITGDFNRSFTLTLEEIASQINQKLGYNWSWRCWDGWK